MRMRTTLPIAAVCTALVLAIEPVWAPHSMTAHFALEKPLTLRGTVTRVVWTNPHPWIYLDVKGPDGHVDTWRIETGTTGRMARRGLKKTDLLPGVEIVVGGYAARDGELKAAGMIVTFPNREASGQEASFALGR